MSQSSLRRDWITKPIFRMAQRALPRLSDTEREAIEAGDVWWDADLFTGNPDWSKLLAFAVVLTLFFPRQGPALADAAAVREQAAAAERAAAVPAGRGA